MKLGSNVSFALLCGHAKLLEVLCCPWNGFIKKFEVDATLLL
jgi:hypothetical protein